MFGYLTSDRRTSGAFPGFAKTARAFEAADPNHPTLFINRAEYNQFPEFVNVVQPMVLDYYHYPSGGTSLGAGWLGIELFVVSL